MYHPRLYGAYYDMGLKYGSLLLEKANFKLPEISKEKQRFGLQSYEVLRDYYPEVVEEISGFAAGIEDKPENVGAFLLSLAAFNTTAQCSVFAYREEGAVIVGRNYDMLFELKKFTESSLIAPQDHYSYISQSDVFIGRADGLNERGLFVAMSFVNGREVQPGVGFHLLVRKALECCCTTQEAINLLAAAPVATANNYLLADSTGDIAVLESAPGRSQVRRPAEGEPFIYITNQFISPEMQPFDAGGVQWSKSTARNAGLQERLSRVRHMDLAVAKDILADKCICLDLKQAKFGTIWSVVASLTDLQIERAETKPSPTNFKPDTRLDWWLKKRST